MSTPLELEWHWDGGLVAVSYFVSCLGAYAGLHSLIYSKSIYVLFASAFTLAGAGIFGMHFIGMEALHVGVKITYEPVLQAFTFVFAYVGCAIALMIVAYAQLRREKEQARNKLFAIDISVAAHIEAIKGAPHGWILLASAFFTAGVCAMHFGGQAAMHTVARVHMNHGLIAGSVVLCFAITTIALYLAFIIPLARRFLSVTCLVWGGAVCTFHYTAMYGFRYFIDNPASAEYLAAVVQPRAASANTAVFICCGCAVLSLATLTISSESHIASEFGAISATTALSAAVSKRMARRMASYDTAGMARILDEFAENPAHDPDLKLTFASLITNLNAYRPHLPTWVLPQADDADAASAEDVGPLDDEAMMALEDKRSAKHSSQNRVSVARRSVQDDDGTTSHKSGHSRSHQTASEALGGLKGQLVRHGWQWGPKGKIGLARVHFALRSRADPNASRFVEVAHRVANETQAVLHCFVGDVLTVSWGTTGPCSRPEVAALRFFARLTQLVDRSTGAVDDSTAGPDLLLDKYAKPLVHVSGAVCFGPATCRVAGGAQMALVIEAPALTACLDRLAEFGAQRGTFVCHSSAATEAVEVATRKIAALRRPDSDPAAITTADEPTHIAVSEVLQEVKVGDDEWMYVLERMQQQRDEGATGDGVVTKAVEACLRGDVAAAQAALRQLPLTPTADAAAEAPGSVPAATAVARPDVVRWLRETVDRATSADHFVELCSARPRRALA